MSSCVLDVLQGDAGAIPKQPLNCVTWWVLTCYLQGRSPRPNGVAQLRHYTLVVAEDGKAELRIPPGAVFTVRQVEHAV